MLKDISSHSYYVNLHYQIQTRTMTRIKQNDDISAVNGNKRKGGNKNPDSKNSILHVAAKDKDNQKRARGNSSILVSRILNEISQTVIVWRRKPTTIRGNWCFPVIPM